MVKQCSENKLENDPSVSHWLKEQLALTRQRDPLDALNDAELLVRMLEIRLENALQKPNIAE